MVDQRSTLKTRSLGGEPEVDKVSLKEKLSQTGSQESSAVPTLKVLAYVRETDDIVHMSTEFHMTIRARVTELTPKSLSMLLAVLCYRAVYHGVDFTMYLALEYLYNRLWRNGHDPLEIKSDKIRKTVIVTDIILSYVRGQWLTFRDIERLPEQIIKEIISLGWLPDDRTMSSWKQHWVPEKYLEVQIVPVEALINRNKYSPVERYSGYTRGYGNDGRPASPGKTKPSPELDGDDSESPPPQLSLQEFEEFQTAIRLIEYARAQKLQRK